MMRQLLSDRGELDAAAKVVYCAMPPTPQYAWPILQERFGAEVWIKHENHTPTGSFKVRGGLFYRAHSDGPRAALALLLGHSGNPDNATIEHGIKWSELE